MLANIACTAGPINFKPAIAAVEISRATKPYSIAVAPSSHAQNR